MWVKICGNTNLEDALLAAEAGADALGFIFAPSPRRVTRGQVAAITPHLPAAVERIGVFVDAGFDEIAATVEECGLTGAQLHGEQSGRAAAMLRQRFPGLRLLRVLHYSAEGLAAELAALREDGLAGICDGVLVDSRTATAVGGTGVAFDWQAARGSFTGAGRELRLIAAGGLRPENVAEAIRTLEPWGVDVVTGVEAAPGKKDPAKVRAFVEAARAAENSAARTRA